MDYKSFLKKAAAGALALVLVAGSFGALNVKTAQAETTDTATVAELQEMLRDLLNQIISLMKELQAMRASEDGDKDDDSDDDSSCTDDNDDTGLSEAEATIYNNETLVKIELDGVKSIFSTDLEDRDDIVDKILDRYNGVTRAEVEAKLTIETEDRDSRLSDKDWADEDASCEEDEDDDDDNSGHGNGDDDDDEDEDDDDDNSGHGNGDDEEDDD